MDKSQAKALKDFVAEAEEILEALSEDLEAAHEQFEVSGKVRPDRVNKIFREMHSLKGLASMLNLEKITSLSHDLESLLDHVRMGKVKFSKGLFGLLDDCRKLLRTLTTEAGEGRPGADIAPMLARIAGGGDQPKAPVSSQPAEATLLLDEATLKSLTEYEEHRLKENLEEGSNLFAIQVGFSFADFDVRLRALTEALAASGEVVSTLPVIDPTLTDGLHFRLLYGTSADQQQVEAEVAGIGATVKSILSQAPRRVAEAVVEEARPHEEAEEGKTTEGEETDDVKGLSNSVKVAISKLDGVMGIIGELNLVRTSLERTTAKLSAAEGQGDLAAEMVRHMRGMNKKLEELQRAIIDIRMVPIGQIFTRLNRTARRLARQANKEVTIQLFGGETELDKMMIDELVSPLVHIIRNSIDHGLEPAEERVRAGKTGEGVLAVSAFQKGNSIIVEVTDDGRGLSLDRIRAAAVKKGLIPAGAVFSEEECMELIFLPGFSSAEKVTEVSGRGVGLDAVKSAVEKMKGSIAVWSESGKGTTFQITLPITLAIIQSLIVSCCGQQYAVPISSVVETFRLADDEIDWVDQREVCRLRGATLPLLRLDNRFNLVREGAAPQKHFVVVARRGERNAGILVDELLGEQETVIHPIGKRLGNLPGIAGATEVGESQVILVIDTGSLLASVEAARV